MLKKVYRLTKHGSFGFVYRKGECRSTAAFSIYYVKSASLKVGFSVSNKLGKAAFRNRLKRRMREAVRGLLPLKKYQIVIVAKTPSGSLDFGGVKEQLTYLVDKAGLRFDEEKKAQ